MAIYYVNKNEQINGDHEIHKEGCSYLPSVENRKNLGEHPNCNSAIKEAQNHYDNVDGCYYCSNDCHNS